VFNKELLIYSLIVSSWIISCSVWLSGNWTVLSPSLGLPCDRLRWFNQLLNCTLNLSTFLLSFTSNSLVFTSGTRILICSLLSITRPLVIFQNYSSAYKCNFIWRCVSLRRNDESLDVYRVGSWDFAPDPLCGAGAPLFPLVHLLPHLLPFYFFLSFIGFTYFLLLSIPSLSTRIVPLRFQAGGRRRRLNLGLVCCV